LWQFAGGAIVGAITGLLNQFCRLPFLLSAIVVNGLFHGIVQFALKGGLLSIKSPVGSHSEWSVLILITAVLAGVFYLILRSQLGYAFAIYGNNPLFFKRHHVSTPYVVILGTCLGGAAAGLSGYLFATANGFVDVTMNYGIVLLGITSLMLGKVFLDRHQPNLIAPFFGVVLFFVLQHALIKCGFSLRYFNAFQAVLILAIWVFFSACQSPFCNRPFGGLKMALKIKNFSLKFGKQSFFHDLSFELAKGNLHTLSGRNGSGKSTLLAALRGDLSAELQGVVEISGTPHPISDKEQLRKQIVLISQRFDEMIADQFSFLQNLEFAKLSHILLFGKVFKKSPFFLILLKGLGLIITNQFVFFQGGSGKFWLF
jgi:ABC-type uncharacterized transport system permease subunit